MSLSQYLEPIEPPSDGFGNVKKRAHKRARRARMNAVVGTVAPVLVLIALAVGVPHLGSSETKLQSVGASIQSLDDTRALGDAPNYSDMHIDQNGLPGGSTSSAIANGLAFYGFALGGLLLATGLIWFLVASIRSKLPLVMPTIGPLVMMIIGGALFLTATLLKVTS